MALAADPSGERTVEQVRRQVAQVAQAAGRQQPAGVALKDHVQKHLPPKKNTTKSTFSLCPLILRSRFTARNQVN